MTETNWVIWLIGTLLLAYVLFVIYKLLHEARYRRKPFIALPELTWQSQQPGKNDSLLQEVVLVGDFGNVSANGKDCVLQTLELHLAQAKPGTAVIFLGDNVYPIGLPAEDHRQRERAEIRLKRQFGLFNSKQVNPMYLSGNHDWNKGRPGGLEQVLRQEEFITQHLGPVFLPAGGCPGPVLFLEADPALAVIVINTQWWVQRGERPIGKQCGCSVETEEEFFAQLTQLLEQNQHRHILIAAHHPLYSNALHGGKHTFKHHVFPLTAAHKKLYIPVPVAGSLYPLYRRYFGAYEDMAHPRYKRIRRQLLKLFSRYNNLVYAAGHDHNLQHFRRNENHYLVSGSSSKTSFVRKGGKASFTHEHLGYLTLRYYTSGQVWLSAIEPDLEKKDGSFNVMYQTLLYEKNKQ